MPVETHEFPGPKEQRQRAESGDSAIAQRPGSERFVIVVCHGCGCEGGAAAVGQERFGGGQVAWWIHGVLGMELLRVAFQVS